MSFANKDMNSTTSSVKSFKCDCCDYTSNRKLNLMRHKNKHLKKVGDEISDISENDEQILTSKECNHCINFKQIIDMKDGRISELERQIELLQKDLQIDVLQTKLECKNVVVDMSTNFIEKQQKTIENFIQIQQCQSPSQPKSRPRKAVAVEETEENPILPKQIKKKTFTKEELAMQDYHESMKEINDSLKNPLPNKSTKSREIDAGYLNEIHGNAEPFEKLIERAFENPKYFEMSNLSEEQLKKCKMPKNDYYVTNMLKFQDHHIKLSKSKNALTKYQVDLQSKEKFYNALFIEAFEKQDIKSFYYVKKTRQSFYKSIDTWKICSNEDVEKILKQFEDRLLKTAMYSSNMLKVGVIPSSRYGYKAINFDILNSGKGISTMPPNERQLLEDLMNHYNHGLMESCNNERMSDILFKQMKQTYDPKAVHNSSVCIKYEKEKEACESEKSKSDDEEEE